MEQPDPCARCGQPLWLPVRFCPFCGARQQPAALVAAPGPGQPDGAAAAQAPQPRPVPPVIAPASRPRRAEPFVTVPAADAGASPPRMEPAAPVAPPAKPANPPGAQPPGPSDPGASAPRQPVVPIISPVPRAVTGAGAQSAVPPAPARRAARPRRRNPNGAAAVRKLAAALFVLFCAAVLWRQLVATPHGTLTVHLSRHADGSVLVDGVATGAPDRPIALSPGRHRIGLDASGFETPSRGVRIAGGETATLTLSPQPQPTTLVLDTDPSGASITLDGHPAGRTPLQRTMAAGRHRIAASLADHVAAEREIDLPPGGSPHLVIALPPAPARTLFLLAPAGRWSEPSRLPAGSRFVLLFRSAVRVRIGGRVILLQPGPPSDLGSADATGISVTAVGAEVVPVRLVIVAARTGN